MALARVQPERLGVSAKAFTTACKGAGDWHPRRAGCRSPWMPRPSSGGPTRSGRQNSAPHSSCQSRSPDFSSPGSQAAPWLPRLLAFPLGEGSRKRTFTAPAAWQRTWCSMEPQQATLNFWQQRKEKKQKGKLQKGNFTFTARRDSPKYKRRSLSGMSFEFW